MKRDKTTNISYMFLSTYLHALAEFVEGPFHGTFHQHTGGGGVRAWQEIQQPLVLVGRYLDLEELEVPLIGACPFKIQRKYPLNCLKFLKFQFGESFDLYNLIVKVVFSFKKLIHARKIFSDCHFCHPSLSEGRLQGGWTRHSLGNNLHTLPKFNVAFENRPSQKETGLPTNIFQGLC